MKPLLELRDVTVARGQAVVLRGVSLALAPGSFTCIRGRSGSGKTSLIRVMALIDRPASGRILVEGRDASRLGEGARARLRLEVVGYIPQHDDLIEELSVAENIALPLLLRGTPWREALRRAREAAEALGIGGLLERRPSKLSGGQRRRAIIARALVKDPKIILADEPLAGLDEELAARVLALLEAEAARGKAVVYATPDPGEGVPCSSEYTIRNGSLQRLRGGGRDAWEPSASNTPS